MSTTTPHAISDAVPGTRHPRRRDTGSILPMALVSIVVMSMIVVGLATYTSTSLRYSRVVEERADRLAAADGGMRYAVERLRLGASRICTAAGSDTIDPPDTNGVQVVVDCQQIGDGFDDTNGWALILTGEGTAPSDDLITTAGATSTAKLVGGPVYMNGLRFDTGAPLEFRYSQLLHTEADCNNPPALPGNVTFDSTSLGLACTGRTWSKAADPATGLFSEPNIGPLPTNLNPSYTSNGDGCRVFEPGHYTVEPNLGSNNYFKSGNYLFDGFTLDVKNSKVTAGRAAVDGSGGSTQFVTNTPCNNERDADPGVGVTTAGATFYLQNGASIDLEANGTFEVLRRKQGRSYVSIHVLDNSFSATDNVIFQGPGANKDMVMHGLVWAPEAAINFDNVTNVADGQLLGGAVLSNITLQSSASAIGFIIAVEPSDLAGKIQLDAVATLNGASTTIRSIVDYRPSTSYTAASSWRVL